MDNIIVNFVFEELKKGNKISLREVGKHFNVNHNTVKYYLEKHGRYEEYLKLSGRKKNLLSNINKETEKLIIKFIFEQLQQNNPISCFECDRTFKVPNGSTKSILKKHGKYEDYEKTIKNLKEISQIKEKFKPIDVKNIDFDNLIEKERLEEYYKSQVSLWKRKYNHLLKVSVPLEKIIDAFSTTVQRFKPLDNYIWDKYKKDFNKKEELILLLSDTHIGEEVELKEVINGEEIVLNEYNIDIFRDRMQKLYEGLNNIVDRFEKESKYKKLNIFMLGDMVSGIIHEELLENSIPVTKQIIIGAEIIADFIKKLYKRFPEIEVYCIVGNHGRLSKKPYFKNKWNNFDFILYHYLKIKFEQIEKIKFHIPESPFHIVNKFNTWNFLLRHGDGKSQSFAGIPMYGIMRTSAKATQLFAGEHDRYIHYEVMGHYHTPMNLPKPAGKIIINGTLKGMDEFSFNNFLSSKISQKLLILNEKRGIFADIDIYCEDKF